MNIEPDLPEVPSFKKIQSLAKIKPAQPVGSDVEEEAEPSEDNFRKVFREAVELLLDRHELQGFGFTPVKLGDGYAVDIYDGCGEFLVRMPGEDFLAYASGAEGLPFLVELDA